MRIAFAFLRRDFFIWTSYRLTVLSELFSVGLVLGFVFFIGNAMDGNVDQLDKYGSEYLPFLLSGFAFLDIFGRGLSSLPRLIRDNQQNGTLEPMLAAPLRYIDLIVASSLFQFIRASWRASLLLLFGVVVLGYWRETNLLSLVVVFLPAMVATFSLAILFAGFVVLIKRADPVITAYSAMAALLGGLLFPVEALPFWLRPLAWLVPLSHTLSGLRLALEGASLSAVAPHALALLALSMVLLPISILGFNFAVRRAKTEGSLAWY